MSKLGLALLVLVLLATPAYAQARGGLTNVYASWVTAQGTSKTFNMPLKTATERYTSRDVWIQNGSALDVCINLTGASIDVACNEATIGSTFQLDAASEFMVQDYLTTSISYKSLTSVQASPISIVVTY